MRRVACLMLAACAPGCASPPQQTESTIADSAFVALQERGDSAMGVNQYASTHVFDDLPDGGRIEFTHDQGEPAAIEQIQTHLQEIAVSFAAGDFSNPTFVHDREMPGTAVMAQKKDRIRYAYSPLPKGGEVRITTDDPDAVNAVHAFMAAQRGDHRASGHQHDH